MLVYSVTNDKSFEDVRDWISDINEVTVVSSGGKFDFVYTCVIYPLHVSQIAGHNVVKIIVGNKTDTAADMRAVSYERGRKVCSIHVYMHFIQEQYLFM